jgi:hypothetical protein
MTLVDPAFGRLYDPFIGDQQQSNRLRADCRILVNGLDVTSKVDPHLLNVRALTGAHLEDYQCEIELDDRDGRLPIPPIGAKLQIYFGWRNEATSLVWDGVIHDVEHGFGRKQGGRRMWIHGNGGEQMRGGKEPQNNSHGEGAKDGEQGPPIPVSVPLKAAAQAAGHTITVHPDLDAQSKNRDYWQQAGEPYYHYATRLAQEMGAMFRVKSGTVGEFTIKGENVDGTPTPSVQAIWGQNLIGWRVRPLAARPMWKQTAQHFFDVSAGKWNEAMKQTGLSAPFNMGDAKFTLPTPAPNAQQAGGDNEGSDDGMGQAQGPGRIVINGEPTAQGNCYVQLTGARPGVDGTYWCPVAEHIYSRQGYITWLDVNAVQITGQGGSNPPYTADPSMTQPRPQTPAPTTPTTPPSGN